jgi:uncharacterized protein YdbL (DUF1318 family)
MMAAAGLAARYLAPMAIDAGKTFVNGKMGENIGGYNESSSEDMRSRAAKNNLNLNQQAALEAQNAQNASTAQQGASQRDTAFNNQLKQSNNRADLQNTMAANDQTIAFRRSQDLGENYAKAAATQAQSSSQLANAIFNQPVAQYGSIR